MKQKKWLLAAIGLVILAIGLIGAIYTYHNSYAQSVALGNELTAANAQLTALKTELEALPEAEQAAQQPAVDALQAQVDSLTQQKLSKETPYSFWLIAAFIGALFLIVGLLRLKPSEKLQSEKVDVKRLTQAALLAALSYIGFTFFKIDVPVGTEKTAFHLGNVFCVLGALLLGGLWGGMAGAVGMTIADLTTDYVTSAPKTFLLKLFIGLIVGLVAHKGFKISKESNPAKLTVGVVVSSACGMAFNIVADPLVGYFYKTYLLGVPQDAAKIWASIGAITTAVNAVIAVIVASVFYLALRPALKKARLMPQL